MTKVKEINKQVITLCKNIISEHESEGILRVGSAKA